MTRIIRSILPLVAGLLVGVGLYRILTDVDTIPVRDRRVREQAPIYSHRAPALPPAPEVAATRNAPGATVAIAYAPRDPAEWQGMLVNTTFQASCDTSSRCGLAMACLPEGRCGACTRDGDCAIGEACALQHCVRATAVACRSRTDCPTGEQCMLTGYSDDPRGNSDLRAYCSGSPPKLEREPEPTVAEAAPLPTDDPGTPEGLVHLLQD